MVEPLSSYLPSGASEVPARGQVSLPDARLMVGYVLSSWMRWSGAELSFSWRGPVPVVTYGAPSLFGAIAAQLALSVSAVRSVALCSNCGEAYQPLRRAHPGERNYCPKIECRQRAARRDQMRDKRARERSTARNG
jgi:hypothetical protein